MTSAVTKERKYELLLEARRSRSAWIREDEKDTDEDGTPVSKTGLSKQILQSSMFASLQGVTPAIKQLFFGSSEGEEGTEEKLDCIFMDILEEGMGKEEKEELLGEGWEGGGGRGGAKGTNKSSYEDFLSIIESPEAADVVKGMQHFVACFYEGTAEDVVARKEKLMRKKIAPWQFSDSSGDDVSGALFGNAEAEKAAKMLHAYLNLTLEAIEGHESFKPQPKEVLGGVLEMFILRKCYARTWELALDTEKDEAMKERLDSLQFLNFEHLDIKCLSEATRKRSIEEGDGEEEMEDGAGGRVSLSSTTSTGSTTSVSPPEDLWSVPLEALRQVDAVKSPIEKLEKIMFASSSITVALRAALGEGEMPGADDFLPALILAIVHANPPNFSSNLDYIQVFAQERQLMSEAGYVLTHMVSAVQFLLMLDSSSLSITKEDYEAGIKRCKQEAEERRVETLAKLERNRSWGGAARQVEEGGKDGGDAGGQKGDEISDSTDPEMERIITLLEEKGCVPQKFRSVSVKKIREMREEGTLSLKACEEYVEARGDLRGLGERREGKDDASRPTYRFLAAEPDNIRISDIPELLSEYKGLVRTVEVLLNERSSLEKERKRMEMEKERSLLQKRREEHDLT